MTHETTAKGFLNEELQLMSCYDTSSLTSLIRDLQTALPYVTDKQAADTTSDCIDKLCRISDVEYAALAEQLRNPTEL